MNMKTLVALLVLIAALSFGYSAQAQTTPTGTTLLSEDFTGATSSHDSNTGLGNWLF